MSDEEFIKLVVEEARARSAEVFRRAYEILVRKEVSSDDEKEAGKTTDTR